MRIGEKTLGKLYILTMTLTLFAYTLIKSFNVAIPWYYTYFHCTIWIFIYVLVLHQNNQNFKSMAVVKSRKIIMRVFSMPYLIFLFFTLLGWIIYINDISLHNLTRALSNNILFFIYLGTVIATVSIFKEKLIDYTFISISVSYILTIIAAIAHYGIGNFIEIGLKPFSEAAQTWVAGGNAANVLETHDLTFAVGFYLIYFISKHYKTKKDWGKIIWCMALIYMGYKRIQLAAILIIIVASIFITKRSKKGIAYWSVLCTVGVLVVMYAYIAFIDSGYLQILAARYNINFMGRLESYNRMSQFFDFSPLYIGRGNGAGKLLKPASGVNLGHSDILYNFIDYGFIGFTAWIIYCFYFATRYIRIHSNPNISRLWLLLTIYAFITYLTDNTQNYFAFQTCYMITLFHALYTDQCTIQNK